MKVICVDANWLNKGLPPIVEAPSEIVTVDGTDYDDFLYYGLVEYPLAWWEADAFIPLSEIDETEMVREHKTEKV